MSMWRTGATIGSRSSPGAASTWPLTALPVPGDGQFSRPSAVCVDSAGYVYVADWGNERVQLLDPYGNFVQSLRGQATLSKWAQDFMSVNPDEYNTRQMAQLVPDLPNHLDTPYLISAQTEPYFWGPASLRLDPEKGCSWWRPIAIASRFTNGGRTEHTVSNADLLAQIRIVVGDDYVIDHREDLLVYEYDGSVDRSMPRAVVLPANSDEVSRVMALPTRPASPWSGAAAAPGLVAAPSLHRKGCKSPSRV